ADLEEEVMKRLIWLPEPDAVQSLRRRYNDSWASEAQAVTTRAEWQQLAGDRILDARAHLDPAVARWSAAYYLVGYAIECGLKSCVLVRVAAHPEVIYEDKRFSLNAWTHDLESLVVLAG